jgi:hypothetical protein
VISLADRITLIREDAWPDGFGAAGIDHTSASKRASFGHVVMAM